MGEDYRSYQTRALEARWGHLRDRVLSGEVDSVLLEGVMDELAALRREIDRRRGERNPTVEVNFEDYVKE